MKNDEVLSIQSYLRMVFENDNINLRKKDSENNMVDLLSNGSFCFFSILSINYFFKGVNFFPAIAIALPFLVLALQ